MNLKKYYTHLGILSAIGLIATLGVFLFARPSYLVAMTLLVLYFAIITALQHNIIAKALMKDPRDFIKIFFGVTVGILMLHLVVLFVYMYTHLQQAKLFTITFLIAYVVFTTFEVIELLALIRSQGKETKDEQNNIQG